MSQPLISILIPFKNTAKFLPECINSILVQTYTNWEVIAINDHSTDTSLETLQSYQAKDERIKVFNNDGVGIINALRTAYNLSTGDYITRMDSDDMMTSERLLIMLRALLEKGNRHLAVGQVKYFSNRGISNGYERYAMWLNNLTISGNNFTEIYKECVIPSPCWMVSRKDLDYCNAFESDRYPEDYDLAFRFYANKLKVIPCDTILLHWRDYDTRTSRTSEHYAQNYFLDIKLHYFLKLDYQPLKTLVVWGAGNKGKTIAKVLLEQNIDFHWVCDNPKKIGKEIYGKEMQSFQVLNEIKSSQSIITVANVEAQEEIMVYFKKQNRLPMLDYFFFC
ncbi:glycosyltransferase [Maribacter sp. CXY002]|uniref:glycosyltransferase n=1 Tax=Maribacter luteocoastalis TaxID=3407671 RepID=UPI003B675CF0